MSEQSAMPLSVALSYVHYAIETGDINSAKSILQTMIRQAKEAEDEDDASDAKIEGLLP